MTMEALAKTYWAEPFRPFSLRLIDGRTLPVPRRESLAFNPKGGTAAVVGEDDGLELLDLSRVDGLDFEGEPAAAE